MALSERDSGASGIHDGILDVGAVGEAFHRRDRLDPWKAANSVHTR